MFKRILLPVDGSDISTRATEKAIELARLCGARLFALYVILPELAELYVSGQSRPFSVQDGTDRAEHCLSAVQAETDRAGVPCDCLAMHGGEPWDVIVQVAREKSCDLIVMGAHGRRGLTRLLLGSETQSVLLHSSIPVLICR